MSRTIKVFGANGCPGCAMMQPIIEELVAEGYNIEIYKVDEYKELFIKEQILAKPTFKFYDNDVFYSKFVGTGIPKEEFIRVYNKDLTIEQEKSFYETRHEANGW